MSPAEPQEARSETTLFCDEIYDLEFDPDATLPHVEELKHDVYRVRWTADAEIEIPSEEEDREEQNKESCKDYRSSSSTDASRFTLSKAVTRSIVAKSREFS